MRVYLRIIWGLNPVEYEIPDNAAPGVITFPVAIPPPWGRRDPDTYMPSQRFVRATCYRGETYLGHPLYSLDWERLVTDIQDSMTPTNPWDTCQIIVEEKE